MDLDDRRESGQEDLTELRVAGQVATDQLGELSSASGLRNYLSFSQHPPKLRRAVHRCDGRAVAHKVCISLRKDHDIAGFKGYCTAILYNANIAPSFCHQVKHDDVFGMGGQTRRYGTGIGFACA